MTPDQIMAMPDDEVRRLAAAEGINIDANAERMRGFLAGHKRGRASSGNYVANHTVDPTEILFANGRVVRWTPDGLTVGWDHDKAQRVFADKVNAEGRES